MFILPLRDNEILLNIKDISDNFGSLDLGDDNGDNGNDLLSNSSSGNNSIKLFFVTSDIFDSQFSFL